MRDGWQTSEFWITTASQVVALLVVLGVVKPADQQTVAGAVTAAITAAFALAAAGLVLWKYIQSRTEVKVAAIKNGSDPDKT